jgi:hypothetical protein
MADLIAVPLRALIARQNSDDSNSGGSSSGNGGGTQGQSTGDEFLDLIASPFDSEVRYATTSFLLNYMC